MHNSFLSIKDALEKLPQLENVRSVIKQSEVVERFFNIFPEMRNLVTPVSVIKSTLHLKVESSVLRSELKFNENLIIDKVNKFFDEERVKKIRFVIR